MLPSLIDVYVNSMLNVTNKLPHEPVVNERIGEEEILEVFKDSLSEEVSNFSHFSLRLFVGSQ